MKIIIAGATGFVATELVRQSLRRSEITSVIALARKPVVPPADAGANLPKLKSVVVQNYDAYPDEVKKELAGASACIWTVAITPTKSKKFEFDEVKRVCQTFTLAGLEAVRAAGPATPFRFVYMSGVAAERDRTKTPSWMPEYSWMRGETETQVLDFAKAQGPGFEACAAKPGLVTGQGVMHSIFAKAVKVVASVPSIDVKVLSAAMIDQAIRGFEKEPLMSDDLDRLGKEVIKLEGPV